MTIPKTLTDVLHSEVRRVREGVVGRRSQTVLVEPISTAVAYEHDLVSIGIAGQLRARYRISRARKEKCCDRSVLISAELQSFVPKDET